jgi:hypothetical protein
MKLYLSLLVLIIMSHLVAAEPYSGIIIHEPSGGCSQGVIGDEEGRLKVGDCNVYTYEEYLGKSYDETQHILSAMEYNGTSLCRIKGYRYEDDPWEMCKGNSSVTVDKIKSEWLLILAVVAGLATYALIRFLRKRRKEKV